MTPELITAARRETWAICQTWLHYALSTYGSMGAVRQQRLPKVTGGVAVIPIHGMISQRASLWSEIFGGTSTQGLQAAYTRAVNEPGIKAVVLDVDSPGGTVTGVKEAADTIHAGSKIKPTYALANGQAASAAYWLGSQAGKFFASPHSDVGSIGVYRAHFDESELMAKIGVKATFVSVPEYKTEGHPFAPLSDEAVTHHMAQVLQTYEDFVGDVARGRGITPAKVKANYGKGRSFTAELAAEMGLVDGVKTLGGMLKELGGEPLMVGQQAADLTALLCEAWEKAEPVEMRQPSSDIRRRKLRLNMLDTER